MEHSTHAKFYSSTVLRGCCHWTCQATSLGISHFQPWGWILAIVQTTNRVLLTRTISVHLSQEGCDFVSSLFILSLVVLVFQLSIQSSVLFLSYLFVQPLGVFNSVQRSNLELWMCFLSSHGESGSHAMEFIWFYSSHHGPRSGHLKFSILRFTFIRTMRSKVRNAFFILASGRTPDRIKGYVWYSVYSMYFVQYVHCMCMNTECSP